MPNKKANNNFAAIIIFLLGLALLIYVAFQIDWWNIELSFITIFFPILFLFLIILIALKVANYKDIDITIKKTDKKMSRAIDRFNSKTGPIQHTIIGLILLGLLAFYLAPDLWFQLLK